MITALNADALQPYVHDWETLTDVYDDLARALSDDAAHATQVGDVFQPGYHAELDELRQLRTDSRGFLAALEAKERERTGIPGLRLHYNRVFGYYIEVSKRACTWFPPSMNAVRPGQRRTLYHGRAESARGAHPRGRGTYRSVGTGAVSGIASQRCAGNTTPAGDGPDDRRSGCVMSFAAVAQRHGYTRPEMDAGEVIDIKAGRHPILERSGEGGDLSPTIPTSIDRSSGS